MYYWKGNLDDTKRDFGLIFALSNTTLSHPSLWLWLIRSIKELKAELEGNYKNMWYLLRQLTDHSKQETVANRDSKLCEFQLFEELQSSHCKLKINWILVKLH